MPEYFIHLVLFISSDDISYILFLKITFLDLNLDVLTIAQVSTTTDQSFIILTTKMNCFDYVILQEDHLEKKIEQYEKFVSEYGGILHKYKHTDIIQCALQLSSNSFIYEAAVEIAKQNPERLYFRLQYVACKKN